MPRRSGKTALVETVEVQRAITYPGHQIYYTAQKYGAAHSAWLQLTKQIEDSPALTTHVTNRVTTFGAASLDLANGSRIRPFTPSVDGLDGKDADLVILDEAFEWDQTKASLLMASVGPTQLNRPNAQLWIVSTAGHSGSLWFRDWVERGRHSLTEPHPSIAFLEWSMDPTGDPDDPDEWTKFHPGLTSGLTDIEAMQAQRAKHTRPEWLRGYCNTWVDAVLEPVVSLDDYDACEYTDPIPPLDTIHLAIDVAYDDSAATIAAAWTLDNGTPSVAIVQRGPGTDWVAPTLTNLTQRGAPQPLADPTGPTITLISTLATAGLTPTTTTARDIAGATQDLISMTKSRSWHHTPSPDLRDALAIAATRRIAGTPALDPSHSPRPIDAARAVAIALHATMTAHPSPLQVF